MGPTGTELYREKDSGLYQEDKKENYLNLNVYSEYARTFNDSHNFKIMLGFQAEEMEQSDLNVFKNGLIMSDMPEFDLTNGQLNSGLSKDATVHGYSNRWATAGFFGRLNYDYQGRYLAEAIFVTMELPVSAVVTDGSGLLPFLWVGILHRKSSGNPYKMWQTC